MPRAKLNGRKLSFDADAIPARRLVNQHIAGTRFETARELVAFMGAVQAQDYAMAKWALGARLPGSTDDLIDEAIDKGEIIRTHVMRPTWHFVPAEDVYWMLDLTARHIRATTSSRERQLGLTADMFTKSNVVIEKALRDGRHLTREELSALLGEAKLPTDDYRNMHLIDRAELDGIICSGANRGKKRTYALLSERVPKKKVLDREEALGTLAQRYFSSHGPATVHDFAWWSGLPVTEARRALELTGSTFVSETVEGKTFWLSNSSRPRKRNSIYVLPAFDEYIVAYQDKSSVLALVNDKRAISDGGVFRPIIVVNGQVTGIWKRAIEKDKVVVETEYFDAPDEATDALIKKAFLPFARFVGKKEVEVRED
jgi:hypothetical protein